MYRTFINHVLSVTKKNSLKMAVKNGVNGHSSNISLDLEVNRIVWLDMEMTGLNIDQDKIMEVACLITDSDLNIIAEGPDIIIHQPENVLNDMNHWCINQHNKTGLTQACLKSNTTVQDAEVALLDFLKKHISESYSPIAGNSVYVDRMFLKKHMPRLDNFLHYRIIDVSTIKELCRRWNPELYKLVPKKEYNHRALQDIKESVDELKFYKSNFFKLC
ncbi:hypothetical protein NQ314_006849 [Rhamnusium bicolor]|uniref:Probable oligoribonuclease n=1 Tax=Rhamnusium bicolor TaxID=1586634 RepID=A0AAV8YW63_9CUCU|nr:hypothetical protein NQ314_006849 [Rhamnusium bicolor]